MNDKLEKLYQFTENHQIGVYFYDLGDQKAVTVADDDFCAIALNPNLMESSEDELTCLTHEVGHIETATLHHPGEHPLQVLRNEYKCACWVVRHLVPIDELLETIEYGYTEVWELAEYFGVTEECILDAVKIYRNKGLL